MTVLRITFLTRIGIDLKGKKKTARGLALAVLYQNGEPFRGAAFT